MKMTSRVLVAAVVLVVAVAALGVSGLDAGVVEKQLEQMLGSSYDVAPMAVVRSDVMHERAGITALVEEMVSVRDDDDADADKDSKKDSDEDLYKRSNKECFNDDGEWEGCPCTHGFECPAEGGKCCANGNLCCSDGHYCADVKGDESDASDDGPKTVCKSLLLRMKKPSKASNLEQLMKNLKEQSAREEEQKKERTAEEATQKKKHTQREDGKKKKLREQAKQDRDAHSKHMNKEGRNKKAVLDRIKAAHKRRVAALKKRHDAAETKKSWPFRFHGSRAYGHGYAKPTVYKHGQLCQYQGLFRVSHLAQLYGFINNECKPRARHIFLGNYGTRAIRVDLHSGNRLQYIASPNHRGSWMSVDGIMWPTRSASTNSVSLTGHWKPYHHSYQRPSYTKQGNWVQLSGLPRTKNHNRSWLRTYMLRLPGGARPDRRLIFPVNHHIYANRFDVLSNGYALVISGHFRWDWVSLSDVGFFTSGGSRLRTYYGWRNYGHSYRGATVRREGNLCAVSGLVRAGNARRRHLGRVPGSCRPKQRLLFRSIFGNNMRRIDIDRNGNIWLVSGSLHNGWLAFDGIRYAVE